MVKELKLTLTFIIAMSTQEEQFIESRPFSFRVEVVYTIPQLIPGVLVL